MCRGGFSMNIIQGKDKRRNQILGGGIIGLGFLATDVYEGVGRRMVPTLIRVSALLQRAPHHTTAVSVPPDTLLHLWVSRGLSGTL